MKQRIISTLTAAALWLGLLGSVGGLLPARAAALGDVDEAVAVLTGLGIVSGCDDGLYHPEQGLTRAQFCKLAVLAEGHGDRAAGSAYRSLFSDVTASDWALPYINLAYEEALVSGKGDGTFGPEELVTVDQAVTVCLRLLGYSDAQIGPFWPEDYLSKARKVGLMEGMTLSDGQALDRGQAALLLYNLLRLEDTQGRTFGLCLGSAVLSNAILLDNNAEAADGKLHTAKVYANGELSWYEQAAQVEDSLVGRRGELLLDKSGKVTGFLPDDSISKTLTAEEVTASAVTDAAGNSYSVPASVPVVTEDEKSVYSSVWYDLEGRELTLYYAESGAVTLVTASDAVAYDGVTLTGYYESASPNAADPETVTLLGHAFSVSENAVGLGEVKVGDKVTVALDGAGDIERAWPAEEKRVDVVAVLDSVSRGTFTHISGLSLSAQLNNTSRAEELEGTLVKLNSTGQGKCSVSALSGGVSGKLNVTAGTLGSVPLSDRVKLYDQVGSAPVVEIELSDILTDTVDSSKIAYAGTNEKGEVDILLLKDVTGDAYTYGMYQYSSKKGTVTSLSGGGQESYTYYTIALENSGGITGEATTSHSFKNDVPGGLALTEQGKVAGYCSLTKVEKVARSDFDGEDYVVLNGVRTSIAEAVEVYNSDSGTWLDLAQAKGYSDALTVYYSGTLGKDAKVRVVVVGE